MSDTTGIAWTRRTQNFWAGCTKISPGCKNCYMFPILRRQGRDPTHLWRTETWDDPIRWNAAAERLGTLDLVFTCSLSDFFHPGADRWRPEAWDVIRRCQNLRFQILTKRPLLIPERLPPDWGIGYPNCWLGVSIESNSFAWRVDVLRRIPARVRFISAEPLLGPLQDLDLRDIHWLIVGGEFGTNFRRMDRDWARQLRDLAQMHGTAFFFKQSSARRPGTGDLLDGREWHEFPAAYEADLDQVRKQHQEKERRRAEEEERVRVEKQQKLLEKERKKREAARIREEKQAEKKLKEQFNGKATKQRWPGRRRGPRRRRRTPNYDWRQRQTQYQAEQERREREERERQQRQTQERGRRTDDQKLDDALLILGLTRPFTFAQVKSAFRKLARLHHPDCFGDPEKFKAAHSAYEFVMEKLKTTV